MENETDIVKVIAASQQKQQEQRAKLDEEKQRLAFERQERREAFETKLAETHASLAILKRSLDAADADGFKEKWNRLHDEAVMFSGTNIFNKKPASP
jgi:hypothetical protein